MDNRATGPMHMARINSSPSSVAYMRHRVNIALNNGLPPIRRQAII